MPASNPRFADLNYFQVYQLRPMTQEIENGTTSFSSVNYDQLRGAHQKNSGRLIVSIVAIAGAPLLFLIQIINCD